MIPKIKVFFYIIASKTTEKNTSNIYCRITLNNYRKQFATGISIETNAWDKMKQKAKGKTRKKFWQNRFFRSRKKGA